MMSITRLREKAAELFGNDFEPFEDTDPFNGNRRLRGFICRASTNLYGSLLITHVDNEENLQLVYGTPKMSYPFDRAGRYTFPKARKIEVFEKIDGTNILGYTYTANGYQYLTFKTRLRPNVANSRFGPFRDMWLEILKRYPAIREINKVNRCNISYELYGGRNKHLVVYSVKLDVAVLFGITPQGNILSPRQLDMCGLPAAPYFGDITRDYVWEYQSDQRECEESLEQVEGGYTGSEGRVWYLLAMDGKVIQLKCKPETVEQIHWAAGGGLGRNVIAATCYNALENVDMLTYDFVKQLLVEEFTEVQVESVKDLVIKVIDEVMAEVTFRAQIIEEYRSLGMDINLDKAAVMRHFGTRYPRKEMRRIYSIITGS